MGSVWYHNEASRLQRLAEQATTEQVRQTLRRQAEQYETAAMELEILAQREEAERLIR
ncbi:MAG TPA: hypothetical protein VN802_09850 [Stellaceae bacterium]|nr:hypothetical protein [Stellaceae bacterium]